MFRSVQRLAFMGRTEFGLEHWSSDEGCHCVTQYRPGNVFYTVALYPRTPRRHRNRFLYIIITIIIIINTKQHSGLTSYFRCTVLLHLGRRRPEPSGGTEGARFWSGGTGEARAESRSPKGRGRAGGVVLGEGSQPLPHQLGVLGECCKLPSVVRSGAPAAEGFSCVLYVVQLLRIEGTAGATCFSKWWSKKQTIWTSSRCDICRRDTPKMVYMPTSLTKLTNRENAQSGTSTATRSVKEISATFGQIRPLRPFVVP